MAEFVIRPFKRTHPGRLPGCECHLCLPPATREERLEETASTMRAKYSRKRVRPRAVDDILRKSAKQNEVTVEAITSGLRTKEVSAARRSAVVALRARGYSLSKIGRTLGVHHTSVLYHLQMAVQRAEVGDIPVPDLSGEWAI